LVITMIKEFVLGSAVLFCAASIINGQDAICLCVTNTNDKIEKEWLPRADCRESKGNCIDECECKVNGETSPELRDYCNSRQHGGYCLDQAEDCNYAQDDFKCLCANNEGSRTKCIKREDCGKTGEPNFTYRGKCTDECYCKIEGCEEGQDCYENVTWGTKEDCWSKASEGYYCSVDAVIGNRNSGEDWFQGYLEQMDQDAWNSDSGNYTSGDYGDYTDNAPSTM